MCEVAFEVGSFHAVGAFYSITHIPRTQQGQLIAKIASWLKRGGMFVASFGSGAAGEWTCKWLGTTMFFGHSGEGETLRYLADGGLRVRDSSVEKQDNEEASFMWARRSMTANHQPAMSTDTIVEPAIGSGTVPVGAISHRLSFIKAGNSSFQRWGLRT